MSPGTNPEDWWDDDDDVRHGTAVAGIAAATGNNGEGVAGVDWLARLVPVKVLDSNRSGFVSWWIQGIDWARQQGIPIVNLSLGTFENDEDPETLFAFNDVCLAAFLSGQVLVAASGNIQTTGDFETDPVRTTVPAAFYHRVVAVGAIDPGGLRWRDQTINAGACNGFGQPPCFASNWGDWLDLEAPGGRFVATTRGGSHEDYYNLNGCTLNDFETMGYGGTSAAAPVVAGAAALLKSFRPVLTGEDIEQLLKMRALNLNTPNPYSEEHGWGFIRIGLSMNEVAQPKEIVHLVFGTGAALAVLDSTPVGVTFLGVDGLSSSAPIQCMRYRLSGTNQFLNGWNAAPRAWVRAAGSAGWRDTSVYNSYYEVPFGRITQGTSLLVRAETFVYRVPGVGWFPVEPAAARIALTVIGSPILTGVDDGGATRPFEVRIAPNPVLRAVVFQLSLPTPGRVVAEIVDVAGRRVAVVADGHFQAGTHELRWDGTGGGGRSCPAGVYFCDCSATVKLSRGVSYSWPGTRENSR